MSKPIDRFFDILLPPAADPSTPEGRAQRAAERTRDAVDRLAARQSEALEQLAEAQRQARGAAEADTFREMATVKDLKAQIADLQAQLYATALYSRTLLQLLVEKEVLTVGEFQQRMIDLDLLDGREDGR
jgi:hypothetical protein